MAARGRDAPFSDLVGQFFDDVKARRAWIKYRGYWEMLERTLSRLDTDLKVGASRKLHLTKLEPDLHSGYSPTTFFECLHAVQRVFNWAVENDSLLQVAKRAETGYSPAIAHFGDSILTGPFEEFTNDRSDRAASMGKDMLLDPDPSGAAGAGAGMRG